MGSSGSWGTVWSSVNFSSCDSWTSKCHFSTLIRYSIVCSPFIDKIMKAHKAPVSQKSLQTVSFMKIWRQWFGSDCSPDHPFCCCFSPLVSAALPRLCEESLKSACLVAYTHSRNGLGSSQRQLPWLSVCAAPASTPCHLCPLLGHPELWCGDALGRTGVVAGEHWGAAVLYVVVLVPMTKGKARQFYL